VSGVGGRWVGAAGVATGWSFVNGRWVGSGYGRRHSRWVGGTFSGSLLWPL